MAVIVACENRTIGMERRYYGQEDGAGLFTLSLHLALSSPISPVTVNLDVRDLRLFVP
jgi:hypothetical protein